VDDNKWHHVSATKIGSLLTLYIDGIVQGTVTDLANLSNVNNTQSLNIGYGGAPFTDHLLGSIDEVRIWNTGLNVAQIRDRMCRKITSGDALYSNLVAYYNFDESTGTTAFDAISNANHGTLINSPTRFTSGAAIGNTSTHNYVTTGLPTANLSVNAQDNLAVSYTAGTFTGEAGTHIYTVNEVPNTTNGITGVGSNDRYFGVFNANLTSPTYTATYNYTGNPFVTVPNEPSLNLFKRTDNAAITTWSNTAATLNTTANTLTTTGQSTEYMLGETSTAFNPTNTLTTNGTSTFASTPVGMMNGAIAFTCETWIKTTENKTGAAFWQNPTIIGNALSGVGPDDIGITTQNGNLSFWCGNGGGSGAQINTTIAINDNSWHHVAAVKHGTANTVTLYLDGINVGSVATTLTLSTNNAPLTIGGTSLDFDYPGNNAARVQGFHQGQYAETRFSNVARYSSNFTPSFSHTTDANTVALYKYAGTCQREKYTDLSSNQNFLAGNINVPSCNQCRTSCNNCGLSGNSKQKDYFA